MQLAHIALIYNEYLPSEIFDDFKESLKSDGLNIVIESKPGNDVFACAEWFIPTVVVAYIGKSYFDGFLKEIGKEHYLLLKSKLSEITNKTMLKPRIEPVLLGTEGKIGKKNPYSLAFSIYAEANDGNRFKLLLPKPSDINDYTVIIYTFLEFLNDYHSGIKSIEDIGFDTSIRPPGGYILVHMNLETKSIEWIDERLYR